MDPTTHMVNPQLASAYPPYSPNSEQTQPSQPHATDAKDSPLFPPSIITASGIEQQTSAASSKKVRLGRIPSARGTLRLSEAEQANYEKTIKKYDKNVTSLKKDVEDIKKQTELNLHIQDQLKKDLERNEEELVAFKKEVKRQLKNKKEADSLKSDIVDIKKDIKDKNNKSVKMHKKINLKAAQEKEVFSQFSDKLKDLKEVRDIIEKNGLLPEKKLEVLNDNITDFQFDLALYENDDDIVEQYNAEFDAHFPKKK